MAHPGTEPMAFPCDATAASWTAGDEQQGPGTVANPPEAGARGNSRSAEKSKHLGVLERANLVTREARGREPDIHLTLERVIDAPVQRVYAAWTDPELLKQWLAPGDAVASRAVADTVVGGTFLIEMRGTDGQRWLARGVYREVAPLRRLVHTWRWEGSDIETLSSSRTPGAGRSATTSTSGRSAS